MSDENTKTTDHSAFGQIAVSHISGQGNLFMVDYPQSHFMRLRISTASLKRTLSNDWVYADREIIEVDMSEVQWARLISAPNTTGVPCTLHHYRDPVTGEHTRPQMPDEHAASAEVFAAEVKKDAQVAARNIKTALEYLETLQKGGPVKKSDLAKLHNLLYHANMELAENLAFVVQQAEEAIQTATEHGKAEVDAHIDYALSRLGERALGERLQAAIDQGVDVRAIGASVAKAVTHE